MKKTLLHCSALGLLCVVLSGCLGAEPGDPESSEQAVDVSAAKSQQGTQTEEQGAVAQPQSVLCSGYSGNGSACQVKCSNNAWYTVGYSPGIPSGGCTEAGNNFCASYGMWATGHCWN